MTRAQQIAKWILDNATEIEQQPHMQLHIDCNGRGFSVELRRRHHVKLAETKQARRTVRVI